MPIGYQGFPGSFSHHAVGALFGEQVESFGTRSFEEIFRRVESGVDSAGVVPLENTLAGSVYENFDHLSKYDVSIAGEYQLRIEHHLLGLPHAVLPSKELDGILVASHIKALEQCQKLFEEFPKWERKIHSDTAGAAKLVSESGSDRFFAVASEQASKIYGLKVLRRNIEDSPQNFTRFVVIEKRRAEISTEGNKISLMLKLPHRPGALLKVLEVFVAHALNLTKIESRPNPGSLFEYLFFLDAEGSLPVSVVKALTPVVDELRVLGVFKSRFTIR